ncbi:MAG: hypothetical protein U9Q92_07370 [archaeon]|nr:hypothetical protein [archaeon]
MSGSSCENKHVLPENGNDKAGEINTSLFQQVAVLRKEMDEQIKEMKELSKATMLTIDKVKKLKTDEIGDHMDRIDARLKTLEDRMAAIDRINDSVSTKKDECLADIGSAKEKSIKLPQPRPALAVPSTPEKPESHVIETTMAEEDANKEKDHIAETIKHYEKEKDAPQAVGKGNIFTKLMGGILPAQKKAPPSAEPERFGIMADASKENGGTAVHNPPEIKQAHEDEILKDKSAAIPDPPEKMDVALEESPGPAVHNPPEIKPAHEEEILKDRPAVVNEPIENEVPPPITEKIVAAPPKEPVFDLLAVDKKDLKSRMEELISSASQMAAEKRYSEATEVYLKLADAYEKNKDDSSIQGLGPKIDELYDKISSNLLTNLMETDTAKKTSLFDQNRNF